jgi:hypothetical protein
VIARLASESPTAKAEAAAAKAAAEAKAAADASAAAAAAVHISLPTGASSAGAPTPAHSMRGAQSRDCCIDMFERMVCKAPPEGDCVGGCDCKTEAEFCLVPFLFLCPRSWRVLNWFCVPYDACCGWKMFTNLLACFRNSMALPLYLPCLVCFALSRCVRSCKGMCSDAAFNAIYIPLLCLALSFRWLWKHLCCARSCCCLCDGLCGPGCTMRHASHQACLVCGDFGDDHGSDHHTCYDGRRGSFHRDS